MRMSVLPKTPKSKPLHTLRRIVEGGCQKTICKLSKDK